jgi:Ca2+-binding RTX toxin-like protein
MVYVSLKAPASADRLMSLDATSGAIYSYSLNGADFSRHQLIATGFAGYAMTSGDVDGDGLDDLILSNASRVSVIFQNANGSFNRVDLYQGGAQVHDVKAGDFDGDGVDELLVATSTSGGPQVWNATRTGYAPSAAWSPSGFGSGGWITGDFNGDGRSDAFTYSHGFSGSDMWLSTGSALAFNRMWTQAAPAGGAWLTGDFDGNGRTDVIDRGGRILLSSGTAFADAGQVAVDGKEIIAVDDFDNDGKSDLVWRRDNGELYFQSDVLGTAETAMIIAGQSERQPRLAFTGDDIMVSADQLGPSFSYRFTMIGSDGSSVEGIWSKLAQARFGLEAAGKVGVLLEVRDDATGRLVSRQYSATGTTVRDPAVVETLLDLSRFTFAEYEGDISSAASERDWRASIGSFDELYDHAASVVAAAGSSSAQFSSDMAEATGFLQFVSGMWGLGEYDGSGGGVMANSGLGVTSPANASVDTYLDSTVGLCTDYAAILALFLTNAGFENRVISGAGHIFNEVLVDGQWWVFDAMVGIAFKGTMEEVLDTSNPVDVMVFENAQADPSSSVFRPGNTDSFYLLNWYHNSVSPGNYRYESIDFLRSLPYGAIFNNSLDLSGWTPTPRTAIPGHNNPEGMALGEFVSIVSRQRIEVVRVETNISALAAEEGWRQGITDFASFAGRVDELLADYFGVSDASDVPMEDRARFYAQFASGLWSAVSREDATSTPSSWADLLAAEVAAPDQFAAILSGLLANAGMSPQVRTTANGFAVEVQLGNQLFAFDPVSAMNFIGGWNAAVDTAQQIGVETYHSVNLQGDKASYSAYAASLRYDLLTQLAGGLVSPSQGISGLQFLAQGELGRELGILAALSVSSGASGQILAIAADRPSDDFAGAASVSFDLIVSRPGMALTASDFAVSGSGGTILSVVAIDTLTWRVIVGAPSGGALAPGLWIAPSRSGAFRAVKHFQADSAGTAWSPTWALENFVGGAGIDTVDFSGVWESPAGVDVDLATGLGKGGVAAGDRFGSIEVLIGTSHDDRLRGSAAAEMLVGGAGGDLLAGEAGSDQLFGEAGDDRLAGGANADLLDGGEGIDTADYTANYGAVWIDLAAGTGTWNWAHGDMLTGIENVVGTDYGDWLFGSAAANALDGGKGEDRLVGREGDDLLSGGAGADILDGGAGEDMADYAGNYGAVWVDLAAGKGTWNWAHGDQLTGIENVRGTSWGDWLYGSSGTNKVYGEDGNDRLSGGAGADLLDGGAGEDIADYTGNFGAVWIDLAAGTGTWNWAHGDVLTGIENVRGTSYGDWLYGSSGANKLYGDDGNDRLVGGGGNDTLDGGAGDDVAYYSGLKDDYRIDIGAGQVTVTDLRAGVDGDDGQDVLTGIERIRFKDGTEVSLTGQASASNVESDSAATPTAAVDGSTSLDATLLRMVADVTSFGAFGPETASLSAAGADRLQLVSPGVHLF